MSACGRVGPLLQEVHPVCSATAQRRRRSAKKERSSGAGEQEAASFGTSWKMLHAVLAQPLDMFYCMVSFVRRNDHLNKFLHNLSIYDVVCYY